MAKARWNDKTLDRYIKEGRGTGELEQYRPWLTTQDYSSSGRSSRIRGWKTGRIHHFLSDIETRYFYLLEFDADEVCDIREHYPILDLEVTLGDLHDIDLNKYRDKESGTPFVFTTTFLLTLKDKDGKKGYVARSVKAASELERARVLERFELMRRYYSVKQIDWGIVTQHDINVTRAKNIEWVHSAKNLDDGWGLSIDVSRLKHILMEWLDGTRKSVRDVTNSLDSQFNLEPGSGLLLLRHLIANKWVLVDMNTRIDLGKPVKEVVRGIDSITNGGDVRDAVDG